MSFAQSAVKVVGEQWLVQLVRSVSNDYMCSIRIGSVSRGDAPLAPGYGLAALQAAGLGHDIGLLIYISILTTKGLRIERMAGWKETKWGCGIPKIRWTCGA